jgi:MoaA/NifB/PqqE/SkfB family radical SAM enzyme
MKITKNIKEIAAKYPGLSLLGYTVLKKVWSIQANYTDYAYPADPAKATVSLEKIKDYNKNRSFGPKKRICYAPFTNMHFQMNGDVSSCSFNYDYTIGNVHRQTIKEIWFGEKAAHFRETLASYNLDKCLSCKKVLESGNYSSFPPLKYDIHADDDTQYPTQMSFEISNLCNYECIMCNEDFSSLIRKNRMNLPPLKYYYPDNFIEQLKEFIPHLNIASFIGGEPLLIKAYFEIWNEILKENRHCTIHIQSNGSYLPPAFLDMLESGQFEIGISIDAPDKETFEKIRVNAVFEEVEQNIRTLLSYKKRGKVFLNFNYCPLTVNWNALPQMVEYANKADVALKIVNVETPRHLALQYRSAAFLNEVYAELKGFSPQVQEQSIITQRNAETFRHFLITIESYRMAAEKRDARLAELFLLDTENLFSALRELMQSNLLFKNFSDTDKQYLFDEVSAYILRKAKDQQMVKHVVARILLSFRDAEHEVDNTVSRDVNPGLAMYKRVIDEFCLLEEELAATELP